MEEVHTGLGKTLSHRADSIRGPLAMLRSLWFRVLYRNIAHFAFHRICVVGEPLPDHGPVLYVCLHRNGALDGSIYREAVPQARNTLSSQLRRKPWMRIIFDGIELVRAKDADRDVGRVNNVASFALCVEHLVGGGQLLFFPEGTSELGPKHLKFHAGVAHLIGAVLERTSALTVVALAAHYEAPTEWQSDVEVEAGAPIIFSGRPSAADIMRAVTAALEAIGLDCETMQQRATTEAIAYAATLGQKDLGYAQALHALRDWRPEAWERMKVIAQSHRLRLHQGIPLVPTRMPVLYMLLWLVLTPLICLAGILNGPVVLAAILAPRKLADAANVISLWRALAGVGVAYLWVPIMLTAALVADGFPAAGVYALVSWIGLHSLYRWRKLSIALWNWWRLPSDESQYLLALHASLVEDVRRRIHIGHAA